MGKLDDRSAARDVVFIKLRRQIPIPWWKGEDAAQTEAAVMHQLEAEDMPLNPARLKELKTRGIWDLTLATR